MLCMHISVDNDETLCDLVNDTLKDYLMFFIEEDFLLSNITSVSHKYISWWWPLNLLTYLFRVASPLPTFEKPFRLLEELQGTKVKEYKF